MFSKDWVARIVGTLSWLRDVGTRVQAPYGAYAMREVSAAAQYELSRDGGSKFELSLSNSSAPASP